MKKSTLPAALLAALLLLAGCSTQPKSVAAAEIQPILHIGTAIDDPYFYMGEDGEYTGLDKEIADEACRRLGVVPMYDVVTWSDRDELLENGEVDCFWECFAMNGRESAYQWAGPYLTEFELVAVAADSDIQTLDDLSGRTIAVRVDSKGEDYFLKEHGTAILADAHTALATFDTPADAFSYFGKGYADAVAAHRMALRAFTAPNPGLYRYLDEPLFQLDLGVAFAKSHDPAVVEALQTVLDEMKADGTIAAIAAAYGADDGEAGASGGI